MVELNKVYCMDNLELLKQLPDNYIDLIYCDILYGTGRNFRDYQDLKCDRKVIEEHYIPRLVEMHRVLKDTGSIYLQMDTRINHWIRCLMDDVFGYDSMNNEIIWVYKSAPKNKWGFSKRHDTILSYRKTDKYNFNVDSCREPYRTNNTTIRFKNSNNFKQENTIYPKAKYYNDKGKIMEDVWVDIDMIYQNDKSLVYNTQKPKALLERIIKASSNENDIVADFYVGSGTSMVVAKELNRQFIGCDISQKAVDITNRRLVESINTNKLF